MTNKLSRRAFLTASMAGALAWFVKRLEPKKRYFVTKGVKPESVFDLKIGEGECLFLGTITVHVI